MKITTREEIKTKLLSNIQIVDNCWEWQGGLDNHGYGNMKVTNLDGVISRKTIRVHRLSYLVFKGELVKNLLVCHTCDNTLCINPDHLFLGTVQDNTTDMMLKGRNKTNPYLHGNNYAGIKVIADSVEYHSYSAAGRALGVSDNAIRKRIKNNWPGYSLFKR